MEWLSLHTALLPAKTMSCPSLDTRSSFGKLPMPLQELFSLLEISLVDLARSLEVIPCTLCWYFPLKILFRCSSMPGSTTQCVCMRFVRGR